MNEPLTFRIPEREFQNSPGRRSIILAFSEWHDEMRSDGRVISMTRCQSSNDIIATAKKSMGQAVRDAVEDQSKPKP